MLLMVFIPFVSHAPLALPASSAPQVQSVLFFAPSCPHCHQIMQVYLPPLLKRYGDRLAIAAINVETAEGLAVYRAVALHFELASERLGVPALVVGDRILVGSDEIPADFAGLIESGLRSGGVAWPRIPEVRAFLEKHNQLQLSGLVIAQSEAAESDSDSTAAMMSLAPTSRIRAAADNFLRDPFANAIAVAAFFFMSAVVMHSIRGVIKKGITVGKRPDFRLPVMAALGAGIAGYLTVVEWSGNAAVCGPIGHCNEVQSSVYARLLGVPVAALGLLTYLILGFMYWWSGRGGGRGRATVPYLTWSLALAGVLFSIYLTVLEAFVIGATCMWCITSAVLITLILLLISPTREGGRTNAHNGNLCVERV
jgi:uncharacterized membrane protein/thiol-disulfide isomerase/thioredoxin